MADAKPDSLAWPAFLARKMKKIATLLVVFAISPASIGEALTSVAEAYSVNIEEITSPMPFDLTGVVLHVEAFNTNLYAFSISDETGGAQIFFSPPIESPRQWDVVRVKGDVVIEDHDKSRRLVAREITSIRHGSPIQPVAATAPEINAGKFDFKFVRISGVFSGYVRDEVAPDYVWSALRTDDGLCLMAINAEALGTRTAADLTDSEVDVTALCAPISGVRRGLGRCLRLYTESDIRITHPPAKHPSDAPILSETGRSMHRQRISGTVVATSKGRIFLRTGIGRIIMTIPAPGQPMPSAGNTVAVAGFSNYAPYWLTLSEALVEVTGSTTRPLETPPVKSISTLFTDSAGRRSLRASHNGARITLRGKVVAASADEMEISDGESSVFVVLDAVFSELPKKPEAGSVVEATGLFWSEFLAKTGDEIFPSFLRFTIYPSDAADVRIISSPPWWTPFRLVILISILAVLLAGSAAWNFMLNRKAERRGRELYEERASHAIAKKKVEERTRLAVELHDSLSQTLTGVAMQLEVGATDTAKTMLTACRGDLRRCLWDLRSRTFEEKDMTEAIERTLEPHSVGAKIAVRFNVQRERLDDSTTHTILRIVRELVVNAICHGKATEIKVAGECHGDAISFSVRDNGCGFDTANAPGLQEGHFGLLGIRERLKEFNGNLKIESSPGQGTKATISMAIGQETSKPTPT